MLNKFSLTLFFLISSSFCWLSTNNAKWCYNPLTDEIFTLPKSPNIDQNEYRLLILVCVAIQENMTKNNFGRSPNSQQVLNQCVYYLNELGTPTALRLADDLKLNTIYFMDGSVYRKIWQ